MATKRICAVEDCGKPHWARGYCSSHYTRWHRTGGVDAPQKTPRGAPIAFIKNALQSDTDECIIWPYAKHKAGFGLIMFDGKTQVAARLVCEMAHGAPKDTRLEAAHACGNGHLACVNPRHLRWATRHENAADQLVHGTRRRGEKVNTNILTESQVLEIRSLLETHKAKDISAMFGISESAVSAIKTGRIWGWLS